MCITSVHWKEGMGESPSFPIKWVPISMHAVLKFDVNVDLSKGSLLECQICDIGPNIEGLLYLLIHLTLAQPLGRGVLGDPVCKRPHLPS